MNDDPFRHLHIPRELACEFVAVFSRLEYALKATPLYLAGDKTKAEALWDRYANDIDGPFTGILNGDTEFKIAADYLVDSPPRKQVLRNGELVFEDQMIDENQSRAQQTILMIRRVRNNLFHGGKHYPDGENEPGRNEQLVRFSLLVLKRLIPLNPAVQERYER